MEESEGKTFKVGAVPEGEALNIETNLGEDSEAPVSGESNNILPSSESGGASVGEGSDGASREIRAEGGTVGPEKRRTNKKKVIVALAVACLVVVSAGVGVWMWKKGGNEGEKIEDKEEAIVYGLQPGEENARKKAMQDAYNEAAEEINKIAYNDGGMTFVDGEGDVYKYEIIERNINKYLDELNDENKRSRALAFSIKFLSAIGDIEGAEKAAREINTDNLSEKEWYCYY